MCKHGVIYFIYSPTDNIWVVPLSMYCCIHQYVFLKVSFPCLQWGNRGSEKISDMPEVTQQINSKTEIDSISWALHLNCKGMGETLLLFLSLGLKDGLGCPRDPGGLTVPSGSRIVMQPADWELCACDRSPFWPSQEAVTNTGQLLRLLRGTVSGRLRAQGSASVLLQPQVRLREVCSHEVDRPWLAPVIDGPGLAPSHTCPHPALVLCPCLYMLYDETYSYFSLNKSTHFLVIILLL